MRNSDNQLLKRLVSEWKDLIRLRANTMQGTEVRKKLDAIFDEAFPLIEEVVLEGNEAEDDDLILMALETLEKRGEIMEQELQKQKAVVKALDVLNKSLAELGPVQANQIFGYDLQRAIDAVYSRSRRFPDLFGVEPLPTQEEQAIQSAELNLAKQKQLLEDIKRQGKEWDRKTYSIKTGRSGQGPTDIEFLRAEKRVKDAELQLAKAKGQNAEQQAKREVELQAKREAEKAEYERGVTTWKEGWAKIAHSEKRS